MKWLLLAIFVTFGTNMCDADELSTAGGPRTLLITYRAKPQDRPAFRHYLLTTEAKRLRAFARSGVLSHFKILFNPFVTPRTWDAMAVLDFSRYEDTARWKTVEETLPGGLDAKGLRLAEPIDTISADLKWERGVADTLPVSNAVYYVIPYQYTTVGEYEKYVNAYVVPQINGWMREGVLSGYGIYLNRDPIGPQWDSLFVLRYRDLNSFGLREATIAKVRTQLATDPEWKSYSDSKHAFRTESENTIAGVLSGE